MGLYVKFKIMNIFFDLDGTLIDSRKRLYNLFQHLVPESGYNFDEYWNLKRNKISHKEILAKEFKYSAEEIKKFENDWMVRIELDEWLEFDRPFIGISDYLLKLSENYKLFVVTARQSKTTALKQINHFGWINIFEDIFVTEQKKEKYDLIIERVGITKNDWFVGDTGKDIQTGKLLGVNTAAVLSGFLSRVSLTEYMPDIIVDDVMSLNFK